MEIDDDTIIIIVIDDSEVSGDLESEDQERKIDVSLIQDEPDDEEDVSIKKESESINGDIDEASIKKESGALECEEHKRNISTSVVKYLLEHEENVSIKTESKSVNGDIDFQELSSDDNFNDTEPIKRSRMLRPRERCSYVQSIIKSHPEFRHDNKMLIDNIVSVMKTTKPPLPSSNHYVMNGVNLECTFCGHYSESIPAAGRHYQDKHGSRYLVCLACGVNFRSTTNLYKHEKRCTAPDAPTVLKARAIFLGRKGRSRPFLNNKLLDKDPKRFKCSECSARFTSKASLEAHRHTHSGARPYVCTVCLRAYTSSTSLSRHVKKHADVRYTCESCQRTFNNKTALIAHMNTHQPLKRFACAECDKRYAQRAALLLHVNREHRGLPPPFACKLCPKRYPRMSVLSKHMMEEHGMMLMTRKMYLKSLPTLSEKQMKQAKLVMKSDVG